MDDGIGDNGGVSRIAELEKEVEDYGKSFDLRWNADMRAIRRWHEDTGRVLTLPDHADLCVWLMERIDELEAQLAAANKLTAFPEETATREHKDKTK